MPQGHLRFAPVVHPEDCPDLIAGGGLLSENTLKVAIQGPDPPYPRLLDSGMLSRISFARPPCPKKTPKKLPASVLKLFA